MSKELEALERLRNTLLAEGYWQDVLQDVSIIEAALKDKEQIDMLLEQFGLNTIQNFIDNLKIVAREQKKLKALEIIKEKVMPLVSLDDGEISKGHYRVYDGELYMHTELTKEEFDLLKEVLL